MCCCCRQCRCRWVSLYKPGCVTVNMTRPRYSCLMTYIICVQLPVWADSENGVNGSDFSKEKILRKRSSAHAQLIKISHFYVKTGHSGKLIVQSGLFICRSENTFKCFIRHISTECIWQKYTFVWQIKFYLLSKLVNSVSDDDVIKSE